MYVTAYTLSSAVESTGGNTVSLTTDNTLCQLLIIVSAFQRLSAWKAWLLLNFLKYLSAAVN